MKRIFIGMLLSVALFSVNCSTTVHQKTFESEWPSSVERTWVGPEYWANRLQDWQIHDGKLECVVAAADRNVNILTRQLGKQKGSFSMSVVLGGFKVGQKNAGKNWAGFRIGIKGQFNDYRDSAIYGKGMNAGITAAGRLFIDQQSKDDPVIHEMDNTGTLIELTAEPVGDAYKVLLKAVNPISGEMFAILEKENVTPESLTGNIALVSDFPQKQDLVNGICTWFKDWKISGSKIEVHDNRAFGPILFSQYTLSNGILKMTAQMPPIGKKDAQTVALQVPKKNGKGWKTVQQAKIDAMARTATFRIENWDAGKDTPYRLAYNLLGTGDKTKEYEWRGTIRKDPLDKDEIVVAAFTGNNDLGFPNNDLVKNVKYHNPDFLFFSGDQIYEGVGGYGAQRAPLDKATLDYLRKWYLYGWAYRDLLKDRPAVSIPDDHDVYHGNVWGAGGKKTDKSGDAQDQQDSGGYSMPAAWVNMVQRTQTSHFPDPYDPTPVKQEIGVYYCEINYGGISFAVIEDRKWKSAPKYTGDFLDGFGNRISVYAVSNPVFTGEKPANLYDRATGYGIVRFNRTNYDITIECWPRESNPAKIGAQEYLGWPIKISQADNYGRKAVGYLPTIKVIGISDPVVQVINERSGEPIYTLRIRGHSFTPKVFEKGSYTVRIGKETGKNMRSIKGLLIDETKEKTITIKAKK